jgi:hypothetical protein
MSSFLGMIGNSDWATDQRPKNWRQQLLYLYPNGTATMTAIQAMGKSENTDDPEYSWWTKGVEDRAATVTGIYTNVALSTAYTSGGVVGTVLYIKCSAAHVAHFSKGHKVVMRKASHPSLDVTAYVVDRSVNGASSYVVIRLLEADDNSTTYDLSDADRMVIVGSMHAEGGVTPDAITYLPTKYSNYTNIFRTSLEMTRTARKTRLRTGEQYAQAKAEALMYHGIDMEWSSIFSEKYEGIGDNGKPLRSTQGVRPYLRENYSSHMVDYRTDANYSGLPWLSGGEDWLLDIIEKIFRNDDGTSGDFVGYAGSGVIKALERLTKAGVDMTVSPGKSVGYGLILREWVTSFGSIYLKTHPLFSKEETTRNSLIIVKPKNIITRTLDDTMFYGQSNKDYAYTSSGRRIDGLNEEFLTELGFEFHFPEMMLSADGFGETNIV